MVRSARGQADFAGSWSGSWTNTTFGSTGAATAEITIDEAAQTLTAVIDLDGNVFGAPDPPAITIDGPYAPDQPIEFTGSTDLGEVAVTFDDGTVTGQITNLASFGISAVDLSGTYDAAAINIDYTITFTDETGATGVLELQKETEEPAEGTIRYVDAAATGAGDGTSWADAFTTLQEALAGATGMDVIVLAAGTYYPDEGGSATDDDRAARFTITGAQDGLRIYGGYAGDETLSPDDLQLDARDPVANETVLSGDIGTPADSTDNSYHVVFLDGASAPITDATVLDGLVITGGQADAAFPDNNGGGLFCDGVGTEGGCSPLLTGLTFRGNAADQFGGAIFNDNASPTITEGVFVGNRAGFGGGGVANDGTENAVSSPVISGNVFEYNDANRGGAIWSSGTANGTSNPQIVGNDFIGNTGTGGALFNAAGEDGTSNPQILNNRFIGNGGSAVYNNPETGGTVDPLIAGNVFSGNTGADGGAIFNARTASPTIINNTFSGNRALGSFFGPTGDGGAIFNDQGSLTITNCIFFGNTGVDDALEGEGADQIHRNAGTVTISHSLIEGSGGSGSGWDVTLGTDGGGNLDADPLFVDADGADDSTGTADDDLHLRATSPAIDAGDNGAVPADAFDVDGDGDTSEPMPFDLAGMSRFQDVADVADTGTGTAPLVDLGAYEANGGGVPVEEPPALVDAFALGSAYPNPFNPATVIPFDVKAPTHVRLAVYDLLGRRVATLVDERRAPGRYQAVFDAGRLASGVYVYVIEMAGFRKARKVLLVK